uniref:Uncharacterized protein n=1 Tax=Strongyloides venezuelensis TaxID=75913 RepID=A0A0K0EU01_STRVS
MICIIFLFNVFSFLCFFKGKKLLRIIQLKFFEKLCILIIKIYCLY